MKSADKKPSALRRLRNHHAVELLHGASRWTRLRRARSTWCARVPSAASRARVIGAIPVRPWRREGDSSQEPESRIQKAAGVRIRSGGFLFSLSLAAILFSMRDFPLADSESCATVAPVLHHSDRCGNETQLNPIPKMKYSQKLTAVTWLAAMWSLAFASALQAYVSVGLTYSPPVNAYQTLTLGMTASSSAFFDSWSGTINWGDGASTPTGASVTASTLTHTYTTNGAMSITLTGT
ncbi:MAG: hypothetical protein RLZZ350_1938, partial [Verrucomicrobiota bacterium]